MVRKMGIKLREENKVKGREVEIEERRKVDMEKIQIEELKQIKKEIKEEVLGYMKVEKQVKRRK